MKALIVRSAYFNSFSVGKTFPPLSWLAAVYRCKITRFERVKRRVNYQVVVQKCDTHHSKIGNFSRSPNLFRDGPKAMDDVLQCRQR
jgi:hypothetical protein